MIKRFSPGQLTVIAMVVASTAMCLAAPSPVSQGFTHVRTLEGISEYRLDANGLTVLLLSDHSAPAVTMTCWIRGLALGLTPPLVTI